jgi:hypothetical protein
MTSAWITWARPWQRVRLPDGTMPDPGTDGVPPEERVSPGQPFPADGIAAPIKRRIA